MIYFGTQEHWFNENDGLVAKNKTIANLKSNNNNNEDSLIAGPLCSKSK